MSSCSAQRGWTGAGCFRGVALRPAIALGVALVAGMWLWSIALTAPTARRTSRLLTRAARRPWSVRRSGRRILIDGGANPSAVNAAVGEGMPFWERSLDLVVLTNTDDAHLAGLVDVLDRYDVRQIIQPSAPVKPTAAYLKWRDLVAQKNVREFARPGWLDRQPRSRRHAGNPLSE